MFTLRHGRMLLASGLMAVGVAASATAATLQVPRDHKTIQAAIDAATSGDTVLVEAGAYKERLRLQPGITEKSAGDDAKGNLGLKRAEATIVDGNFKNAKGPGVAMAEDSALDGFTVTGVGKYDDARPIIRHNRCYKNKVAGIGSRRGARPVIVDNESRENQMAGIGVRDTETVAVIVGNRCIGNRLVAVGLPDGATSYIHGNELLRTGGGAPPLVAVKGGSTAVVSHNSISGGGVAGVLAHGDVRIIGNRFQGKGPGQGSAVWLQTPAAR